MPREIVVITPQAPDTGALLEAAVAVDPDLRLRSLATGAVHQLVRADPADPSPAAGTAVLSVSEPLRLERPGEIRRLLPVDVLPAWTDEPYWWVDAVAPWDEDAGRLGVQVAQALALGLGGLCVVLDGE